jgi:hypothetical protein
VALPLLVSACAETAPQDELAGETAADDAIDGKADSAVDGAYTYFEVWADHRRCAFPMCGGMYLQRLNRTTTICHDGALRYSCYAPELDWSQSGLPPAQQQELVDAANRGASSYGAIALVRGRFASKSYPGVGNLGRFIVTEAWIAQSDSISFGVFAKVRDAGVRCVTWPCESIIEKGLNTSRSAMISEVGWAFGGFDPATTDRLVHDMVASPGGVIVAGDRYLFKANNQWTRGRTAYAAYRRLTDAAAASCFVGGCSSQLCTDEPGAISTCEWRDEYACYHTATCERQADGQCGWTDTPELQACLGN